MPAKRGVALNPLGTSVGPTDAKARRGIGEALRSLFTAEELGRALLSIAGGVDPFAEKRGKKNADNLPVLGSTEIDWAHRMAALKMFAEYSYGKPLQGVVVEAQVNQQIAIAGAIQTGPVDFGNMNPAVRAALRLAACAALGRPLPQLDGFAGQSPAAGALARPIDVDAKEVRGEPRTEEHEARVPGVGRSGQRGEPVAEHLADGLGKRSVGVRDLLDGAEVLPDRVNDLALEARNLLGINREQTLLDFQRSELVLETADRSDVRGTFDLDGALGSDVDGLPLEVVPVAVIGVGQNVVEGSGQVAHGGDSMVRAAAPAVKVVHLDFRDSSNLVDAVLEDSVLTVRFRAAGGGVARSYRYANVTPAMMDEWREAPSAGAWFARAIRQHHKKHPVLPAPAAAARVPGIVL